jgi:hypothetical protein
MNLVDKDLFLYFQLFIFKFFFKNVTHKRFSLIIQIDRGYQCNTNLKSLKTKKMNLQTN